MIGLLMRLLPRHWRQEYGDEFEDMLASRPLTALALWDVIRLVFSLHAAAHSLLLRVAFGLVLSAVIERIVVSRGISDNILWAPSTLTRAVPLVLLVLSWGPAAAHLSRVRSRSRRARS